LPSFLSHRLGNDQTQIPEQQQLFAGAAAQNRSLADNVNDRVQVIQQEKQLSNSGNNEEQVIEQEPTSPANQKPLKEP